MVWYLQHRDGRRTVLPRCSRDWHPSAFWVTACLHDPVGPICRNHRTFFRNNSKENS
jgi:hypothetical protein